MEAAAAAAKAAKMCQVALKIITQAARLCRAECKVLDAAEHQQDADMKAREARAALARKRLLTFNAHNSSFRNSWCIDLHGEMACGA
ncbi:hypothetical protein OEZ85_012912 [Tetradesmus obliquus]|uniref:Uncharacterized protein n=1 Tax=Tetradesmus obliquus TaxID=3088 RepID=A0ABY8U4A0_TETOB|nr:hypothetical protein OEZ85_012912 [Tetradesmus obliquus]